MSPTTPWRSLPVGARVSVRSRLTPAQAAEASAAGLGAVWTDVIAVVLDVDDDGLTVRTDAARDTNPRVLRIEGASIHSAKLVPPRPERRRPRNPLP